MTRAVTPILLVDDHDDVREGLKNIFEAEGCGVETARDPREALNKLRGGFTPCIILLDLMSPIMNGIDFHRELKSDPRLGRIPLLAYAGVKDVRTKARLLASDEVTEVPAEIDRLLAAVRQHCLC
ncbi:MAG: response regulator [Candidatus Binatia bacterium]